MSGRAVVYVGFLVSLGAVGALPRSYQHPEEKNSLGQHFSQLQERNFKAIAMIMFAQYVQGGTVGRAAEMAEAVTALAKRCAAAAGATPECLKPLDKIFLDTICQEESLPRFTDCCAKKDPERNDCFLTLKNSSRAFVSPFERPNAEAACRNYSQHHQPLTGDFIYEVSRSHPFLYAPTILSVALRYEEMLKDCCGSVEEPAPNLEECFQRQAPKVVKPMKEDGLRQEHTCAILNKFGERTLKALKLTQISQKFPKADFVTVTKLVTDIANMHKGCCRGDTLDCMHKREEILHYVCSHQGILSREMKKCCEKPLLQRIECLVSTVNDDQPAELSRHIREFIEDKGICEHFAQEKDTHLARFLYEYSRRHPDFSAQMLLRIGKGYEELLTECCQPGAPDDCSSRGEEDLKKHIYETESVIKTSCDAYKEKGDYYFQNELLVSFTKKMPQLMTAELIKFTKQMTAIGSKCCRLSRDKLLPCAEENLDLVLGEICRRHMADPINPGVCHCCSASYAFRRPCVGKLELDESYVPLPLTPGLFDFHKDLCTREEEQLQHKKQEMLVNLIKYKPRITQEQLSSITATFAAMREQCCQAGDPEACFAREGPELIKRSEKMLSA
ncbi:alpha-fetoprotein [Cuculus canorus]|uniref:alpha-fetoprotein n=1 Tax=Cuculus canorus TaxID=55661 RepID=UPI0023AB0CD9|nr:alpha-fetoprotein [Cuculus canorus]XP_053920986.1 alpha-fetoprotein [Cuculus canorus]XP_053920987.1 alpha-fetoprotein [Cuculus canorus]XP_053920988.1 alpha-fetoprotein [Cuculus canorus]